ncbi:hypothetical protein JCM16358_16240 [Halanaerocella petrolearia]
MDLTRLISIVLVVILILPVFTMGGTEIAYASEGADWGNGFFNILRELLNLLFFGAFEDEETSSDTSSNGSTDSTPESQVDTETDWKTRKVTSLSQDERKMLEFVNQARTKQGLEPLKTDYRLVKVARAKSRDMIKENYFSHDSPNYGSPFDMMKELNIDYYLAGENIAGASEVKLAHDRLMASKGHRKNILHSEFTHIGIGIIDGGPYGKMYTQEFADLEN